MSLLPYVWNDWDLLRRPLDLFDQNFGGGLLDEDLLPSTYVPLVPRRLLQPWTSVVPRFTGVPYVANDKDGFKVNVDVQQFKPDEITVKVVDNSVVVEGKHEERPDQHGYIQRQFTRRYTLPPGVDAENVSSSLSSDGVLTVCAPPKALQSETGERIVPITHTQAPAIQQQQPKSKEKKTKEIKKKESK